MKIEEINQYIETCDASEVVFIEYSKKNAVIMSNHFRNRKHSVLVEPMHHEDREIFMIKISTKPA